MPCDPVKELNALLSSKQFSRQNSERVARICLDAARLVYERQKQLNKIDLKPKDISAALILAETLSSGAFRFVADGNLVELFGGCNEDRALKYYEEQVMGLATDNFGRKIEIDEDGMRSLYKDPQTGRHEIASDNYEEVRGKRLPWIRPTLEHSNAVYTIVEQIGRSGVRRKFMYTATVSIRLRGGKEQTSYYLVVVNEGKNAALRFVTAYSMFERTGFLHAICMGRRYITQNKGVIS